ncbi:vam6/Vps39-like protein isoform X2 [Tubulanus polymorphus]|uniref:vam6/Vps39-like protein isoform X2 n=1 Tax=Tubulanus polymorphus TaxID=672921 RepID=UPI003DA50E7B
MHDAFEAVPILEKLPLAIESIACFEDTLLVGTRDGFLLVYKVRPIPGAAVANFDVSLEKTNKAFARKPVVQLAAIPEFQLLISLSDNQINVHDLTVYAQITTIPRTKGANLFAIDLQETKTMNGEPQYTLRLCVSVRRRLQLYYWKNRDFHELQPELCVSDLIKSMAWCKDSVCVGFTRDYFLINIASGNLKELFTTGKQRESSILRLKNDTVTFAKDNKLRSGSAMDINGIKFKTKNTNSKEVNKNHYDDRLALIRDDMTIFINQDGDPLKHAIKWTNIPSVMAHHPPYLLAVLPKYVEVWTIQPKSLIQSIELKNPKLICESHGTVYVSAQNYVWRLAYRPIADQIKQLLQSKAFELALKLATMIKDPDSQQPGRIHHIQTLYACDLFGQKKFEESMNIFLSLGVDPSNVIGMFPQLLPPDFRSQLNYPEKPPELEGVELEKGLLALIDYLTQKRNQLIKDKDNKELRYTAIVEGNTTIRSKKQLHTIIDTTLLKCYLQTNDALVASLLRLPDNHCHEDESERVLKKYHKYDELVILYERKGLHRKALELLLKHSCKPTSSLEGHERTIQYLQQLGPEYIELIFEYARWVIQSKPNDGIKIFTEDLHEVETLPRDRVLAYIEENAIELAIPYLEHVITVWNDETVEFHNRLITLYRTKCDLPMVQYLATLESGAKPAPAGSEPGELGSYRTRLLLFLETSECYTPERLLTGFPSEAFYEERALLLGRLGRHDHALAIYVLILKDIKMAEEYCKKAYSKTKEGNKDVYLSLLRMYLAPPDTTSLGLKRLSTPNSNAEINVNAALSLLQEHAAHMNTAKALELLPASTKVRDILNFLENVLEDRAATKRDLKLLRCLLYAEHLQVAAERINCQSTKFVIDEEKTCKKCKKRIGTSAFARHPNGDIVHFYCYNDPKSLSGGLDQ